MPEALLVIGRQEELPEAANSSKVSFAHTIEELRRAFSLRPDRSLVLPGHMQVISVLLPEFHHSLGRALAVGAGLTDLAQLSWIFKDGVTVRDAPQRWLPMDEILDIMSGDDARDFIIGGMVLPDSGTLVVHRGDLSQLFIPLSHYIEKAKETPNLPSPDPEDFAVIDYGHAIRLGAYDIATDALLYEFDPEYRKRIKARRLAEDNSFGGAFKRLRLQRGLTQKDFPGLSSKTIERLERNKHAPEARTLAILSKCLGVEPEDIQTF